MTLFEIVTVTLGITRAAPQLARLLRARHAYGVSIDTAAAGMVVSAGWATYGYLTGQPALCFASSASGLILALITIFALRFGRQLQELKVAPVWILLLSLFGGFGKGAGLGLILPVSVLAANIPQIRVAYREKNLSDLSLGMWLISLTEGLVWGSYGLIQHDTSILVNSAFQIITSGIIVALKLASVIRQSKQNIMVK